ncbi:MAG: ABC transporter substrate-binding protein [Halomonas sp.]|uniref:ABC transporter substrate-binding protein n=1 Tax=Halomonas sp. TaxID=1486246 RepID=UPI0017E32C16|nr:ABC transporter substrate-binding protein [Halomonas sp.]NWN83380.1 ABC transporter substrate-binding protein [Halomonas sp.]
MAAFTRPLVLVLTLAAPTLAAAEEPAQVRFAVPAWPGVTVKSQLAGQLLAALDYAPRQQELGSTIAYEALNQSDVDAYLAAWLPGQSSSYDTAMDKGVLVDLGSNVEGARLGFAVPTYVYEAGVTSGADLADAALRERFDGTIYSIEVGSGISEILNRGVGENVYGLADWQLSETSTPGMLSTVEAAIAREEWVVFGAWTPHWMNIEYDVQYLDDPEDLWGEGGGSSDVKSLITKEFSESNPNAARLLDQLVFSADDQSAMIYGFSYEESAPEAVALEWMRDNPERVEAFLDGVTTRDGSEDAWHVVQKALEIPDA